MKTLTIKINEHSKAGKAFLALSESFLKGVKGIEIIENDTESLKKGSPYNPEFVEMVLKSAKSKKNIEVNPNDVWGSLGLK